MDFPEKKSLSQIKKFWSQRAEEMNLTPSQSKSHEFDMVNQLSAAQETYGPQFWYQTSNLEDVIYDCLTRDSH